MQVRRLTTVPKSTMLLLAVGFCAQLSWHFLVPLAPPRAEDLPPAPSIATLRLTSLGDPVSYAKILLLYLQTFDNQPGVSAPFRRLDYPRLASWLNVTLQLDPPSQYPLFLASQVYGDVGDPAKKRLMFNFVYEQFFIDPNRRWRSLAYAATMTRHQLNDFGRAEQYAEALRLYATENNVPSWARQMDIFMLEDMGLYQRALDLTDELLKSGQVTDAFELRFLQDRRDKISAKAKALQ